MHVARIRSYGILKVILINFAELRAIDFERKTVSEHIIRWFA